MHTKSQIQQLLLSAGVRPNKRFGQHFLIDLNLMRLLIDTADIQKNDVVLEIGCGTGSLTEAIAERAGFCVTVEIDATLADIARTQLSDKTNIEIIAADALKNKFEINPFVIDALNRACSKYKGRLLLVSNLPYVAATPLMLNLITGKIVADAMFVTVQKEVANRMTARPGTKDYGILSILLAATGDTRHIRTLKPTVFWPQPKVDSAMISYIRDAEKLKEIKNIELLSKVAGALLQHRRKMLKSCCRMVTGELGKIDNWLEIFDRCNVNAESRPDQLSPQDYVQLANSCYSQLKEHQALSRITKRKARSPMKTVKWGNVRVRLRTRIKVDENLIEKIFTTSCLAKSNKELLLIIDDKDAKMCTAKKWKACSFSSKYLDLIKNATYYDCFIDTQDIAEKAKWEAAVYIPCSTAVKWKDFEPYFVFVLAHELEHVRIMTENLEFHMCMAWLGGNNLEVLKEAGICQDVLDSPWEVQCNRMGKEVSVQLSDKATFVKCIQTLRKSEQNTHWQRKLDLLVSLEGTPYRAPVWKRVLIEIQKYYQDGRIRKAAFSLWDKQKANKIDEANLFNLEDFLPRC
ncbi:MAG: 16S rRNA (adenine(1518)-N(6)/adenine(1519)-N(6))-dimethyltransferase RsmA [Sedimentisphaerales bacterium]|nr:16S rRNA (adenine(1518)-N(6)/adenine(1519)-N(6))-dimethyltransferase RsmA [Sedimentisphaerales bacterium]